MAEWPWRSNEEIQQTLLWLAERIEETAGLSVYPVCQACGHGRTAHVVAGDADNPTPWPCAYPKNLGAPQGLCRCLDYLPQGGPDE